MPKKLEWFPWYPWRWVASQDVQLMPPSAQGYYMMLLSRQWIRMESTDGGGLPVDSDDMFQLAGGREPAAWAKHWPAHLEALFPECPDGQRRNPTLAEVWLQQRRRVGAMSAGGARGAASRWGLQLQMGDSSVANGNAFTSSSIEGTGTTAGPVKTGGVSQQSAGAREETAALAAMAAADWLRELPRAAADKVRVELKRRLPYPDDWDLRKIGKTAAATRAGILTTLHKEAMDGHDDKV